MKMKTCTKCKIEKVLAEFSPQPDYKDGLKSWCKACVCDYGRRYRADPDRTNRQYAKEQQIKRGVKTCTKCGLEKELTEFGVCSKVKDGRTPRCTVCTRIDTKNHYWAIGERAEKRNLKQQQLERGVKTCTACGVEKKLVAFNSNYRCKDGHASWCRVCMGVVPLTSAAVKKRTSRDKKKRDRVKKRVLKERAVQRQKEFGVKTCTKCGVEKELLEFYMRCSSYMARCKVCEKKQTIAYRQTEAGKAARRRSTRKRRAKECGVTINSVDETAIYKRCGNKCAYCGSTENLSLDHIVALAAGGPHTQDNLTVACQPCNSSKGTKSVNEWLKTRTNHNEGCEDTNAA